MLISLFRPFAVAAIALAFVAGAASTPVRAEDGFASPQALLDELYGHYADKPAGSGVDLSDAKVIATYFTPEMAGKIEADAEAAAAKGDVPALDGDPFVDAQDWEVKNLDIAVGKSSDPEKTEAVIRFKNYGEDKEIKLSLAKGASGWQIADIDWGYDKLSKILAPQ